MATTFKVLGQSAPADTNNANLYTVPAGTSAIISTITISNVTAANGVARVYVRVGGATASIANAIVYDASIPANSTIALTLGITLAATDVLTVRSATANGLTFMAFGQENS